jgi:hypothetical protein
MKHTENCWTLQDGGKGQGRVIDGVRLTKVQCVYRWNTRQMHNEQTLKQWRTDECKTGHVKGKVLTGGGQQTG